MIDKLVFRAKIISEKDLGTDVLALATTDFEFSKRMFSNSPNMLEKIKNAENNYLSTGCKEVVIGYFHENFPLKKIKKTGVPFRYSGRHLTKELCKENIQLDVALYFSQNNNIYDVRKFKKITELDPSSDNLSVLLNNYYIPLLYNAQNNEIEFMSLGYTLRDFSKGSCIEAEVNKFVDLLPRMINKTTDVQSYIDTLVDMYTAMKKENFEEYVEYKNLLDNVETILF